MLDGRAPEERYRSAGRVEETPDDTRFDGQDKMTIDASRREEGKPATHLGGGGLSAAAGNVQRTQNIS